MTDDPMTDDARAYGLAISHGAVRACEQMHVSFPVLLAAVRREFRKRYPGAPKLRALYKIREWVLTA